jgi:hypothetical protein
VVGVTGCAKSWPRAVAMGERKSPSSGQPVKDWYCFGRTLLAMDCEDRPFSQRFKSIYGECAVELTQEKTLSRVDFRVAAVQSDPSVLAISVTPNLPDGADLLRALAPERQYVEFPEDAPGWRMLALAEAPEVPVLAFGPSGILVSSSHAWQHVISLYAISTAIWLRPDVYVLHAASVGISGRGILLSGAKGMGKTTLSLCFASRGHAFLGDEWAAVSSLSGQLLPLRRAASIRPGQHPAGLDEYLRHHKCNTEILPDGTQRVRTRVGLVFPRALPQVVPLTDIFFLRRFAPRPMVERFSPGGGELPPISPILASVWGFSPGERAIDMFRTLGKARWWHLDVGGSPEETADLVEETLKEESWD